MYRIAIVEDQAVDAHRLETALDRFAAEKQVALEHTWVHNAVDFLEEYRHQFDLIFMDIRMPDLDGMTAARKLREIDHTVVLTFLTSLAQYAVEGYTVDATDFILKPITYAALELKLPRMLARCRVEESEIVIQSEGKTLKLRPAEVLYAEIYDHHIQVMTGSGVVRAYGTLKEMESALPKGFFRVNNSTIINLRYVTTVDASDATVNSRAFPISRGRRKEFLSALHGEGMKN